MKKQFPLTWQKSEPYYDETGKYRAFPGLKPKSVCAGLSESQCTGDCIFVKDSLGRKYCRGHSGSALATLQDKTLYNIETKSASYVPKTKDMNAGSCSLRRSPDSCESNPSCTWIEDSLGRHYCRTNEITPSPKEQFLRSSRQVSAEEKEAMYDNSLDEAETKMCRCLVEVAWDDFLKNGQITKNPYAICNFTIARSRASSQESDADLRSKLAQMTTGGGCTKFAHFDNFPTEFLYSFAKMRESTSKGKQFFGKLPDFETFSKSPESFRPVLIKLAKNYQMHA